MQGLPKIVLERLKRKTIANPLDRQSTIENQPFPHPDANLLAAFVEKTLSEKERTQVLNHLAQCAECRELAALTLPREVEVALPVSLTARRSWSAWPALRWGVLATALVAVAIVLVFHPYRRASRQESVSKEIGPTIAANASKASPQPPADLTAQPRPQAAVEKPGAELREPRREMAKLEKGAGPAGGEQLAARSAGNETKQQVALMAAARPPAALEAAPSAESQAGASAVPANAESAAIAKQLNAAQAGGVPAPGYTLSGPLAPVPMRASSQQAKLSSMAFRGGAASAVAQLAALWSISASGKVQRSDDGGKTWEEVRIDEGVTFRAIQAMGTEVWAGGSGGALYHSSDGGAIWKRINLSSGGSPTTDTIVAIVSPPRDLQHITVKTASGEQWTSDDGGQHWQKEP
jgi:hypothetical protein